MTIAASLVRACCCLRLCVVVFVCLDSEGDVSAFGVAQQKMVACC